MYKITVPILCMTGNVYVSIEILTNGQLRWPLSIHPNTHYRDGPLYYLEFSISRQS